MAVDALRLASDNAFYAILRKDYYTVECEEGHVEDEVEEELEIALSDTVSHPNAMVVHSKDAPATSAAVVHSWRFHALTLLALVEELVLDI